MTEDNLWCGVMSIVQYYQTWGLKGKSAMGGRQFISLQGQIRDVYWNVIEAKKLTPDIKMGKRIQENIRGWKFHLHYNFLPACLIIWLVWICVFWISAVLHEISTSCTFRPQMIMTDGTLDLKNHCLEEFGAYNEMHARGYEDHIEGSRDVTPHEHISLQTQPIGRPLQDIDLGHPPIRQRNLQQPCCYILCRKRQCN